MGTEVGIALLVFLGVSLLCSAVGNLWPFLWAVIIAAIFIAGVCIYGRIITRKMLKILANHEKDILAVIPDKANLKENVYTDVYYRDCDGIKHMRFEDTLMDIGFSQDADEVRVCLKGWINWVIFPLSMLEARDKKQYYDNVSVHTNLKYDR